MNACVFNGYRLVQTPQCAICALLDRFGVQRTWTRQIPPVCPFLCILRIKPNLFSCYRAVSCSIPLARQSNPPGSSQYRSVQVLQSFWEISRDDKHTLYETAAPERCPLSRFFLRATLCRLVNILSFVTSGGFCDCEMNWTYAAPHDDRWLWYMHMAMMTLAWPSSHVFVFDNASSEVLLG